jgi:cytochrome P450
MIDEAVRGHRQQDYNDMLARLMNAKTADGEGLTNAQLHAQTLHMYFAMYGGIFRTLTLLFKDFAIHPDVMERARNEVMQYAPDGTIDLETLGRLAYLDQVTREVRRHNRIFASTNFDVVTEPFEYEGYHVPKGWKAAGGIYTTMQAWHVFNQPTVFDPDRFNNERAEHLRAENSYIPQGGGSMEGHRCPAEDLTTFLMKAVAVNLLRSHTWELQSNEVVLDDEASPMPRDGLMVNFKRLEPSAVEQVTA